MQFQDHLGYRTSNSNIIAYPNAHNGRKSILVQASPGCLLEKMLHLFWIECNSYLWANGICETDKFMVWQGSEVFSATIREDGWVVGQSAYILSVTHFTDVFLSNLTGSAYCAHVIPDTQATRSWHMNKSLLYAWEIQRCISCVRGYWIFIVNETQISSIYAHAK